MDASRQLAPSKNIGDIFKSLAKYSEIGFALAIVGILMVLLFPVPTVFLDLLLAFSITTSILILMTCLFISKPLEFSVFPTVLLITAMLRLSLNIASTRLILSQGHTGPSAAGHVIEAFGSFVMEGNIVIGVIVFIILTIINFVVITKGSGRIAEVAARFSLDAMPGKQMAIDADLSAGLIDEPTAKARRKELEDESTFFGSMDGANKFVRGDAVAGLLITFINFIAGIVIGVVQKGLTFSNALNTYTTLTIGDGLVSQMPSLVISLAAGLLVSKSGVSGTTDKAIFGQLGKYPQALGIASALMILMACMPGIPSIPFLTIALGSGGAAWGLRKNGKKDSRGEPIITKEGEAQKSQAGQAEGEKEEKITETLQIDSIRIELGYSLLSLINHQKGHRLIEQVKALRKQMAKDLGFVIPAVRIQDNLQLANDSYLIKVKDIECARGEVRPDKYLVMDPRGETVTIAGELTTEPAFGLPAKWIEESSKDEAIFKNYTVVDSPTVITTHLTEVIKDNITELLSYSETQKLLDSISDQHKKLVDDTIPSVVSINNIQRILQNLLSESVSIRDLPTIIEAIAEFAKGNNTTITQLTEHVRSKLARQISYSTTNSQGFIPIISLSHNWEQIFMDNLTIQGGENQLSIPPSKLQEFIVAVRKTFDEQTLAGHSPVLMVNPLIRPYVRSIIERFRPLTQVISQNEIHIRSKIKTLAQI